MPRKGVYVKAKAPSDDTRKLVDKVTGGSLEIPPKAEEVSAIVQSDIDPWTGLSERQRHIQSLKMRNLSQHVIAKLLGISQSLVNREVQRIREVHKERGIALDKEEYVGRSITLFEEIMAKAWTEFYAIPDDNPLKAQMRGQLMNLVMTANEKQTKMLMEIGLIQKAKIQVEHSFKPSAPTLVDNWDTEGRENLAGVILTSQLKELEAPQPPEEEYAEFEEVKEEDEFESIPEANNDN